MRLRSDIFVAALIRRAEAEGAFATLRRRGAPEAGAIFVLVEGADRRAALYGPAPAGEEAPEGVARLFRPMHETPWSEPAMLEERLQREISFDPDLWIVEIDDRQGRCFLDLA
jgi:hypothetical protein